MMRSRHIMWLSKSPFKTWNERKTALGFAKEISSEFINALLHSISEESKKESTPWHPGDRHTRKPSRSITSLIPSSFYLLFFPGENRFKDTFL